MSITPIVSNANHLHFNLVHSFDEDSLLAGDMSTTDAVKREPTEVGERKVVLNKTHNIVVVANWGEGNTEMTGKNEAGKATKQKYMKMY